jgi:small conductance mechanosensitive channel
MSIIDVVIASMQQLINQLIVFIPKIIIAALIWFIGKYLLVLAVRIIKRVDIKGTKIDNKIADWLATIFLPVGKFFLILIVLDYLGVGRTVISAVVNGFTFAVAIALGIAFGKALEDDAKRAVLAIKKQLEK